MPNSIMLKTGETVLVDPEDYAYLSQFTWSRHRNNTNIYVRRCMKERRILMHTEILGTPSKGLETDHINGNGLDNRKANLRVCTRMQNQHNRSKTKKGKPSSKYKGVSFIKQHNKWRAAIAINKRIKHLGYFENEIDAAIAYNKAAVEYFKEYANINSLSA